MANLSINANYLTTGTAKIWYEVTQDTHAKDYTPLICIHGGPGFPHNYLDQLRNLASTCPVVLYDQSGCGNSQDLQNPNFNGWSLQYYIDELKQLVEHICTELNVSQVYLLGHSWGGALATAYAAQHPNKVKKLILSSPLISTKIWENDCIILAKSISKELYQTIEKHESTGDLASPEYIATITEFYRNFFCRLPEHPANLQRSTANANTQIYTQMWGNSEIRATGSLKDLDLTQELSQLAIPTLFVTGEFDTARPDSMLKFAKAMKQANVAVLSNCGHAAPAEDPERYLAIVKEFLINGSQPMRKFLQNKLWRDKAPDMMEQNHGSIIHWRRLDDQEYDQQLRLKLLEEAAEAGNTESKTELIAELADVMEVIKSLCDLHQIDPQEIETIQTTKALERGGFTERKFVTIAEHPKDSFGEKYCLADPAKYPEVF